MQTLVRRDRRNSPRCVIERYLRDLLCVNVMGDWRSVERSLQSKRGKPKSIYKAQPAIRTSTSDENRESSRNAAAHGEPGLSIVNRAEGIGELEGKTARVAVSKMGSERVSNGREHMSQSAGQRMSFKTPRGTEAIIENRQITKSDSKNTR